MGPEAPSQTFHLRPSGAFARRGDPDLQRKTSGGHDLSGSSHRGPGMVLTIFRPECCSERMAGYI